MADVKSYLSGVNLHTGAGTDYALKVNLRLSSGSGSIAAMGQKAMASSIPVVLASDHSAIVVDTELPAAASLADGTSNPSTTSVGALNLLYNGTTWDRMRGDTSNGLDVDVTRLPALAAGTNNIGDVDVLTVPAPLSTTGGGTEATALRVTVATDSTGVLSVDDNGGTLSVDDGAGSLTVDNAALSVTGGGVESSALRVTLASDSTGVLSVDDNGGSLTVDGTVAISGTVTVDSEMSAAATLADNMTNPSAGGVAGHTMLFDGSTWDRARGTSTGGMFVQGAAVHDAAVVGNPVLIGGYASSAAPTDVADGDAARFWLSRQGAVRVALVDDAGDSVMDGTNNAVNVNVVAGSAGGTQYTEDAAAAANPVGNAAILVRTDTPAGAVSADGDNVAQRGTNYGAAYVTLLDTSGNAVSIGGGTQYDEDTAHSSGDKLTMAGVVRADSAAALSGSDGDRTALITDATGRLWCNVSNTVTVGSHAVTNAGTFAVQESGSALTALQLIDNIVQVEDGVHSSGHSGVMALAVRSDAGGAFAADGDYVPLSTDADGALRVTGGGGGTEYTEDAAAAANPVGSALMLVREDARGGSLTSADGDNVAARGTNAGELYVKHVDSIPVTDNGGSLTVDNGGTFAVQASSVVPGTGATNLGKAEDAAHSSGDVGVMALSVRQDTAAALAGTDADYQPLITDASGRLHVNVGNTVTVGSHAVTNAGTFAVQESGSALTALQLIDNASVDHDAVAVAGVVQKGVVARTSDITPVSSGDAVRAIGDTLGKQVVLLGAVHDLHTDGKVTLTDNNASDVIAAAGSGIKISVMSVVVTNGHASVSTKVTIRRGTTAKITGYAAAAGGGFSHNGGGHPLFITSANEAVTAICTTTGADVDVFVSGYTITN